MFFTDILLILFAIFITFIWVLVLYMVFILLKAKVPLVPTDRKIVEKMTEVADLSGGKKVYDLGSGLGHVLLAAEKIRPNNIFVGYELLAPAVWWANWKSKWGNQRAKFIKGDIFEQDLEDADVIFCYLFPGIMERFYIEIFPRLKPGTKIVSHAFKLKDLKSQRIDRVGKANIFLYIR